MRREDVMTPPFDASPPMSGFEDTPPMARGPVPVSPAASASILFVTPEMSDFTRIGGLGEVSAALPRALRTGADVRVMIPGYRDVLSSGRSIEIVGRLPARWHIPACE